MTVAQFWTLIMVTTLVSIAVATYVAVQFHWGWGLVAYFVCDFILDAVVISYAMKHLK
jgi:hypothetical protein